MGRKVLTLRKDVDECKPLAVDVQFQRENTINANDTNNGVNLHLSTKQGRQSTPPAASPMTWNDFGQGPGPSTKARLERGDCTLPVYESPSRAGVKLGSTWVQ